MRLPNRKPGKYTFKKIDPQITQEKFDELSCKLEHMKKVLQPRYAKEVKEHAANGDFSENAEYQIAKGRLRGLNRAISEISEQLNKAQIIKPITDTSKIQIGHEIKVQINSQEAKFKILGSAESDPKKGIISYSSPLGRALLEKSVGDVVEIEVGDKIVKYRISQII